MQPPQPVSNEWHNIDQAMVELNRLKQHSRRLNLLNKLHGRMAGMLSLASMIEAYSVWLMPNVTHELIGYNNPIRDKKYLFCSGHGPNRRSAIAFAEQIIDSKINNNEICKNSDGHYSHRWVFETSDDAGILLILKDGSELGDEEISLINDSLDILSDSLQRGLEYEDLFERASHDMLTGLSNRRVFDERIKGMMESARRYHRPLTILSMDLDHFKDINDTHGHLAGDEVLKSVAKVLTQAVRSTDLLIRMGGDEFLLVLDNTDKVNAQVLAERVCRAVDGLDVWADKKVKLGVSIGLAQLQESERLSQWLERADDLLYQSKADRRLLHNRSLSFSTQEKDLQLFLDWLSLKLPPVDPTLPDDYMVVPLDPHVASVFEATDNKVILLAYRSRGIVFPISLVFLRGQKQTLFCHSTLLFDTYEHGDGTGILLKNAVQEFFSKNADSLLGAMDPSWVKADITGQLDCRIFWNIHPEIPIVTDLFLEKLGQICDIPLFPTVYYYNNPYEQNLLEVALPELGGFEDVLILGTGAGLEAICVALKYGITVDATDINPLAVANTIAACRRTGTDHLVKAWVSDGLAEVEKAYDVILFEAPLATDQTQTKDPNRFDLEGKLLKEVLTALPSHLKIGGRMYLMSHPDLSPYLPANGFQWKVLRNFTADATEKNLAILEVWRA